MPIPMQENCDPDNPHEAFAWALVGLPGPRNSPMLVHPDVLRKWSKHLWDLGMRHHPEEQTKEFHPPVRGTQHWVNGSGSWLPKGTPRQPTVNAPDMSQLTPHERADVVQQLRTSGELRHLVDPRDLPLNLATVGTAAPTSVAEAAVPPPVAAVPAQAEPPVGAGDPAASAPAPEPPSSVADTSASTIPADDATADGSPA